MVIGGVIAMVLLAIPFGLLQVGSLVAIDIVGGVLGLSLVTFGFILATAFATDALVGVTVARWASARMATGMGGGNRWQEFGLLVAGAAAVVIVTSIPIIGGWVKLAVVLFGIGAFTLAFWEAWRSRRRAGAVPAPSA